MPDHLADGPLPASSAFEEVSPGVFGNTAVSDLYRDRQGSRLVIEMLTVPCEPNQGLAMLDMMMLLYFVEARPV